MVPPCQQLERDKNPPPCQQVKLWSGGPSHMEIYGYAYKGPIHKFMAINIAVFLNRWLLCHIKKCNG